MDTVPEWVFKRITFHQTEEEMMAHAIMANNVTCLNINAWHYEYPVVIRAFMHPDYIEGEMSFSLYQLETACILCAFKDI